MAVTPFVHLQYEAGRRAGERKRDGLYGANRDPGIVWEGQRRSRRYADDGRCLAALGRAIDQIANHRGDVVVFALPSDPSTVFIKRLIGLPGDRIQMLDGVLYLNDKPVPKVRVNDFVEINADDYEHHIAQYRETLPGGKSYLVLDSIPDGPSDNTPVYIVPPGHYFMMGDNRDDSDDSRGIVGYLPAENLVGKAEFKFFSIDGNKTHWWSFWTWPWAVRYSHMFTLID